MAFVSRASFSALLKLREASVKIPTTCVQLRWRKVPRRKPKWLPTAPSKVFRIAEHPYVSPDESQLKLDLLEEFYRKMESLRKIFRQELAQKNKDEGNTRERELEEEARFLLLLEQNKEENERVRSVREETMEKLFQAKQLELLQLEENRKIEEQERKARVEQIVRKEKEKGPICITHETLEEAIGRALDSPKNLYFTVDVNGNVNFEGNAPREYEEEIKLRIAQSMEN